MRESYILVEAIVWSGLVNRQSHFLKSRHFQIVITPVVMYIIVWEVWHNLQSTQQVIQFKLTVLLIMFLQVTKWTRKISSPRPDTTLVGQYLEDGWGLLPEIYIMLNYAYAYKIFNFQCHVLEFICVSWKF
jgi:hypothetical protein